MNHPEQHVIDEIDRLVDWQIDEGKRRGDGPAQCGWGSDLAALLLGSGPGWRSLAAQGFEPIGYLDDGVTP